MKTTAFIMKTHLCILVCMLLSGLALQAQLPAKGDWQTRRGTKNPEKAGTLFQSFFSKETSPFFQEKKPVTLDFYRTFRELTDLAPYSDYVFYNGALFQGENSVFVRLLNGLSDMAMKTVIVEDLLSFSHNIVDNLDSVNVLRNNSVKNLKGPEDTLSLPVAMTRYAHLYYTLAGNPKFYPAKLYDKEQARENFRSAFYMLRERNVDPGQELEAAYVSEYYRTCEELYKSNEEKYYEQFLQDYLEIVQTCDNLLIPYWDVPDSIKNDQSNSMYLQFRAYNYETNHHEKGIKARFKKSGAAAPEKLSAYYMARLKDHKNDVEYLNKAINLMNENEGCTQTEAFYSYCKASNVIKPTYLNCIGCAFSSRALNMRQEMINYFLEAYKLATNDLQRGLIAYQIGSESNSIRPKDANGKNYGKETQEFLEWEKNMMLASANLKQVLQYQDAFRNSSSIAVRKIPAHAAYQLGLAHYRMAGIEYSSKECDVAISYIKMAMAASPEDYNSNAEGMLNNINNARAQYVDREIRISKDAKQRAEQQRRYDEYMRKKKAEEAFWGN